MGRLPVSSIGVIGGGVLGRAVTRGFMEWADVRVYDLKPELATHALASAASADLVFICLPTPANEDGTCNTSAIDDFLHEARQCGWWRPASCYVIRSTVPVGYTNRQAFGRDYEFPIFHSPEFLTARCSIVDFQTPSRNIVGVPDVETYSPRGAIWGAPLELIETVYRQRFPGAGLLRMPSDASELVKLATNALFAAKVSMMNLIAEVAGERWRHVRDGILTDGRITHAHTAVPGPDGLPGFGGTCLPKDTASLFHCAEAAGVNAEILREVLDRNHAVRHRQDSQLTKINLDLGRSD